MTILSLIQLFLILPVILVSTLNPNKINNKLAFLIILPALSFSLFLLLEHKTFNLIFLPLGILLGFLLFILSIWITNETLFLDSFKDYMLSIQTFFKQSIKQFQDWDTVLYITLMVVYEELIWRVFLVETLSKYFPAIATIFISSFIFYYSHPNQRELTRQSVDLFLFSLIITSIYFLTQSFLLVFLIHWIRNVIIIINITVNEETIQNTNT